MCKVLSVSRSGFYAWCKDTESRRSAENRLLVEHIQRVHARSRYTYGSPRIAAELRSTGIHVSRPRVARLMRKAEIRSIVARKYVATTDSKHSYKVAENLLARDFAPGAPGEAWVSDITYIRTDEGWLYLTMVMDLADRQVIGWALGSSLKTADTTVPAWKMAIRRRPAGQGLIFHSDRGVQYACPEFTGLLKANGKVVQSMSGKGNCWDNAVAESFFKTLKTEWVYGKKYMDRKQAALSIFEYIETWYNTNRKHSALKYMTPTEYLDYLTKQKLAA